MDESIARLAVIVLPIVLAITLHEAAHGYMARLFGDPTAALAGRISLNPLRHIDPVGTIAVPLIMYFGSALAGHEGLLFGWAKPVPVNFSRLRHPKRDMLWVAAAGPGANLLMAMIWMLAFRMSMEWPPEALFGEPLRRMAEAGVVINLVLMLLNLLPIPPLDGGRIMISLLPLRAAMAFSRIERYGLFILLALLLLGGLDLIMAPMLQVSKSLLLSLFF